MAEEFHITLLHICSRFITTSQKRKQKPRWLSLKHVLIIVSLKNFLERRTVDDLPLLVPPRVMSADLLICYCGDSARHSHFRLLLLHQKRLRGSRSRSTSCRRRRWWHLKFLSFTSYLSNDWMPYAIIFFRPFEANVQVWKHNLFQIFPFYF